MPERQILLILLANCSNCIGATLVSSSTRNTSIGWVSKTAKMEKLFLLVENMSPESVKSGRSAWTTNQIARWAGYPEYQ